MMRMLRSGSRRCALSVAAAVLLLAAFPAMAQKSPAPPSTPPAAHPGAPPAAETELDKNVKTAMDTIFAARIKANVKFLASDLLEGRGTGQRGGELSAEYVATQYGLLGLGQPVPVDANTTSYFQSVPLVGVETDAASSTLTFTKDAQSVSPAYLDQAVYWTETQQPAAEASSEVVFVGYGALAPEFKWDDFKDVDLTGKILLMLVNDPPSEDPNFFGGKGLTYYGRWTYKFWVAAEKGAAGAILIHNTDMAGYGWDVVRNSWGKERSYIQIDPQGTPPLRLAGWVTEDTARQVVSMAGRDLTALMEAAARSDFKPVPLGITASARLTSKVRNVITQNVVGFIPGADPVRQREFVIYTAHYDHLGIGQPVGDDSIYNGAQDNASGVSAMLEVARAFMSSSKARPRRSLLFIALAAEEQGLRGSEHFCNRRNLFLFPGRMAADINLDGISTVGETRDYVFLGADRSTLKKYVDDGARLLDYVVKPDPHPEKGHFYRSDHFNFARIGVPSMSIDNGLDYIDHPAGWGEEQYQDYLAKRYHQPDDEFDPTWDFKGVARVAKIAFYLGWRVAMDDAMPMWNQGDEFEEERKETIAEVPAAEPPKP